MPKASRHLHELNCKTLALLAFCKILNPKRYSNFINYGLLRVITFAILNKEASIRVAGTDILVAMIDHDPGMVRAYIFKSIGEKTTPLTDTLIELLLVEVDLGVKAQAADAIKVLLEPPQIPPPQAQAQAQAQAQDAMARNGEFLSKMRGAPNQNPQTESFIAHFYEHSANKLFKPLKDLEKRRSLKDFTFHEVQLFNHLVEIIIYLSRTHQMRSKYYIFSEGLGARISQLLSAPQKHLRLTALKFFRQCIGLQDEHYNRQLMSHRQFGPILNIVYETMPRDNLLNSACLELFEFIRRENLKPLIRHLAEEYGERLQEITYVDTFKALLTRYHQMMHPETDMTLFDQGSVGAVNSNQQSNANGNQRWQGMKDMDADEEAYFNTSDDEDELQQDNRDASVQRLKGQQALANGVASSPMLKALVDYPDDEDDLMDTSTTPAPSRPIHILPSSPSTTSSERPQLAPSPVLSNLPLERLSEKRRREEDSDEDELGKLSVKTSNKRRNSGNSNALTGLSSQGTSVNNSSGSGGGGGGNNGSTLRRKKAFVSTKDKEATTSPPSASAQPPSPSTPTNSGSRDRKRSTSSSSSSSSPLSSSGKIEISLSGNSKASAGFGADANSVLGSNTKIENDSYTESKAVDMPLESITTVIPATEENGKGNTMRHTDFQRAERGALESRSGVVNVNVTEKESEDSDGDGDGGG